MLFESSRTKRCAGALNHPNRVTHSYGFTAFKVISIFVVFSVLGVFDLSLFIMSFFPFLIGCVKNRRCFSFQHGGHLVLHRFVWIHDRNFWSDHVSIHQDLFRRFSKLNTSFVLFSSSKTHDRIIGEI